MKQNIKMLYLYPKHDADLCGLLNEVGIKSFRDIARDSLRILLRPGYIPKTPIPKFKPMNCESEYEKVMMIPLSLKSEKDADVRELISHIKYRQFNSFIKTALRFYIGAIPTLSCLLDMELIKTIPVYTPNGVIVFPSEITNFSGSRGKSSKQKKDTIKKANDVIVKTVEKKKQAILEDKSIDVKEDDFKKNTVLNTDLSGPVNTTINTASNLNPGNEPFNTPEGTASDDTEVDVLSLLENLLD